MKARLVMNALNIMVSCMILNKWVSLTEKMYGQYERLYTLIEESSVNVTAIKGREEYYIKHVLDSIYYFAHNILPGVNNIADIGSGGGFPGLALAVYKPDWTVTLIESIGKKCRFMEQSAVELGLNNVTIIQDRAEKIQGKSYDMITSRGVGSVSELLKFTLQLAHKRTNWLLYKGERAGAEINDAAQVLHKRGLNSEIQRIETPFTRSYLRLYPANIS